MKIASGFLKNRSLSASKNSSVRPTSAKVRSQVFNICQHYIEGASFLDLCAGTGAIGFEAISRGAKSCTFVEKESKTAALLNTNIHKLGIERQCSLFAIDALQALSLFTQKGTSFSFVYIDPPYEEVELLLDIIKAVDTSLPLEPGARILVETRKAKLSLPPLSRLSLLSKRTSGDTDLFVFTT